MKNTMSGSENTQPWNDSSLHTTEEKIRKREDEK